VPKRFGGGPLHARRASPSGTVPRTNISREIIPNSLMLDAWAEAVMVQKHTSAYRGLQERQMSEKPKDGDGVREADQSPDDLQDGDIGRELPAGLQGRRKGPLNPSSGRRTPQKT
jgi:hypothetical protein